MQVVVNANKILDDIKIGDSIAVNGVCLTVTEYANGYFIVDVMPETFEKTTLTTLKTGSRVNLERALRLADRLGGHLVQGHVDGTGVIIAKEKNSIAIVYRIKAKAEVLRYIVPKGSIAVDGISLTVIDVDNQSFTVSLIPHTAEMTVLGAKREGDLVNLESDIIGRYVEKLIKTKENPGKSKIDLNYLAENGFI
jgi:riboflavin synthase